MPKIENGLATWRLRKVLEHIDANLDARVPLADLAAISGLSRFHFARMFARATGLPPHEFVSRRKIERAKGLLEDGALPLAEVAFACGFKRQTYFTNVFRQRVGITPGRYRRDFAAGTGAVAEEAETTSR